MTRLQAIGRTIKELREQRRWNQAELGRRARPRSPISHTTISKIENGDSDAQFTTLDDIAAALGTTLSAMLDSTPAMRAIDQRRHRQIVRDAARDVHPDFDVLLEKFLDAWQQRVQEQQGE